MRKRLLAGAAIPLVAALGIWLGLGGNAAARTPKAAAHLSGSVVPAASISKDAAEPAKAARHHAASEAESPSAPDNDNVQSGDQSTPDTSANESANEPENGEETSTSETDGVDCQQQGEFDGVNTAGTGPGCDGTGT